MSSRSVSKKVLNYLAEREQVSVDLMSLDLGLNVKTSIGYLSRLSRDGLVIRVASGLYRKRTVETSEISKNSIIKKLEGDLKQRFPFTDCLIWSLGMLADYSQYNIGRDLIFIEVDKNLSESIRDYLREKGYNPILKPEKRDYSEYTNINDPIFIETRREDYGSIDNASTLERMWIDVYFLITRKNLAFSVGELGVIFRNVVKERVVNYSRLMRYSRRRGIENEVVIFLYRLNQKYPELVPTEVITRRKEALKLIDEMIEAV